MAVFLYDKLGAAKPLVSALGAVRARRFDGLHFWDKGRRLPDIQPGDRVINWGTEFPSIEDVLVLNGRIEYANTFGMFYSLNRAGLGTLNLTPRSTGVAGWTQLPDQSGCVQDRTDFVTSTLLHVFGGKSLLAGAVTSSGIQYDGAKSTVRARNLAKKAVNILKLDFAAIEVGELPDHTPIITGITRAPLLNHHKVIHVYREALQDWLAAEVIPQVEDGTRIPCEAPQVPTPVMNANPFQWHDAPPAAIPSVSSGLAIEREMQQWENQQRNPPSDLGTLWALAAQDGAAFARAQALREQQQADQRYALREHRTRGIGWPDWPADNVAVVDETAAPPVPDPLDAEYDSYTNYEEDGGPF